MQLGGAASLRVVTKALPGVPLAHCASAVQTVLPQVSAVDVIQKLQWRFRSMVAHIQQWYAEQ